jgi:hypothetical protein
VGAVKVNNSTIGGAVKVNYSTIKRQQGIGLAIGKAVKVKD